MKIEFFMPMIPPTVTHQEKAVKAVHGKPVFYEPAKLTDARAKLKAHLFAHRPQKPLTGPVRSKPCGSSRLWGNIGTATGGTPGRTPTTCKNS